MFLPSSFGFGSRVTATRQWRGLATTQWRPLKVSGHSWHAYVKSRARARWLGLNVSHANNKTKRRFLPDTTQYRRFWVETENRWVRLRVSSAALRLIDKNGIDSVLADMRARGQA